MSWKLFGQIVLLMVIGALILYTVKFSMLKCSKMRKYKHMKAYQTSPTSVK